jgi:hypothetical protein
MVTIGNVVKIILLINAPRFLAEILGMVRHIQVQQLSYRDREIQLVFLTKKISTLTILGVWILCYKISIKYFLQCSALLKLLK